MTEERRIAEDFLDSLLANGLVLDTEREHAVLFLENYGKVSTLPYVVHYSLENDKGELSFATGTQFSTLEGDMLFDSELRWHLLNALVSIRVLFQNQAHHCITEFLEEEPSFCGVLSGVGADYTQWSEVIQLSLEILVRDYDVYFPDRVKEKIAQEYGLLPEVFYAYMKSFAAAYSLAESGRKLLDIRFLEQLPPLPDFYESSWKWNYRRTMVGNIILLYDAVIRFLEREDDAWLEKEIRDSLSRYEIRPERIGLTSDVLDFSQLTIEDQVFLGRPLA